MGYMCTCITTTWATCVHVSPRHGLHVYMCHHDMGYMCACVHVWRVMTYYEEVQNILYPNLHKRIF